MSGGGLALGVDGEAPRLFYTVREAADVLRVAPMTIYRAIGENAFPAVKIRSRYVIPAKAAEAMAEAAAESGQLVEIERILADQRDAREFMRRHPEWT
jgi:excisionase family DNA binding protein